MFHKIENGDIIKVIPNTHLEKLGLFIDGKLIYEDGGILEKIRNEKFIGGKYEKLYFSRNNFYCIYINNNIKFIKTGLTLKKLIDECKSNDEFLKIEAYFYSGFISYDKSILIKKEWTEPEDYSKKVESSKKELQKYLKDNGAINNLHILRNKFGDVVSEILSEYRELQLNSIMPCNVSKWPFTTSQLNTSDLL